MKEVEKVNLFTSKKHGERKRWSMTITQDMVSERI